MDDLGGLDHDGDSGAHVTGVAGVADMEFSRATAALLAALAAVGTSARAQTDTASSGAYGLLNDKWVVNVSGFWQ